MNLKNGSQNDRVEEYGEYVLSRTVKSVHRTYFLDVRATKGEDLFVSITESRKRQNPDGTQRYDRHKIVLYKEDILRFCREFGVIEEYLKQNRPGYFASAEGAVAAPAQRYSHQYSQPEEFSDEPCEESFSQDDEQPELTSEVRFEESAVFESDIKFEDL